jgi:CubicO group peptidase (beta-lactamase class C family)
MDLAPTNLLETPAFEKSKFNNPTMKHLLFIAAAALLSVPAYPQQTVFETYLDPIFKSQGNKPMPGVAITLMQNQKVLFSKDYGLANLEHNIPFSHSTPVRLGYSGAREFMCVGLALMEEEGLINFNDKVKGYFPNLPDWSAEVTIQDLLNHSSGFDDEWGTMLLMQANMNNRVDKEQLLKLLYNQPSPQVQPGVGYMYSNSDFALLRWIMEAAAKKNLPAYLKQKLFDPLGMTSTFMNDHLEQIIPGLAGTYVGESKYFKLLGVKTSPAANYRIVTTAADLEKWAVALEDSNSIPARSIQRLYKNARAIPVLSPEVHYVFGHEWQRIGETDVVKHGGVNHDFYMARIPSKGTTIIVLGNSNWTMSQAFGIIDYLLAGKASGNTKSPSPTNTTGATSSQEEMQALTGRYFEQRKPGHSSHIPAIQFYDLKQEGGKLNFYLSQNDFFTLTPEGKNTFKDPDNGSLIQFSKTGKDSSTKMQIILPDGEVLHFSKDENQLNYSAVFLRQFQGQYHSKHLDYYLRILANDKGELIIRRPTISDKVLIPYGPNRFLFEMESGADSWYVVATFTKNAAGEVDGINMQHMRMMHHRFDKVSK